ncbi:GNAT family N-acetyltransferase [Fusibacter ferrireducens]|uniref:GNAT family N-acetyltransferase n=1 Tax=Fusibacter ferrireducens TaxID=2785058 RepID=A0ABR9ZPG1_9FIRM|nr:GNAT family N-acetyltransferase [Fusibacter ferrireducens]MBF4692013.1 GNAT family N-acetyltransferase [Fusibacter ferrireducens]
MKVYLETERLIIRDPIIEDFNSIWKMRRDETVTQFTGGVTKLARDEAYEKHLKRCENFDDTAKEYAVVLKATNEYIGYCGFQYCSILDGLEILYGYDKQYWGNGYAVEAAKAILEFGLNQLNLDEVLAAVNYENVASDKVLIKIGMQYAGDIEWPEQGMVKKYHIKS